MYSIFPVFIATCMQEWIRDMKNKIWQQHKKCELTVIEMRMNGITEKKIDHPLSLLLRFIFSHAGRTSRCVGGYVGAHHLHIGVLGRVTPSMVFQAPQKKRKERERENYANQKQYTRAMSKQKICQTKQCRDIHAEIRGVFLCLGRASSHTDTFNECSPPYRKSQILFFPFTGKRKRTHTHTRTHSSF